jgi:xanthine dehydrogenase YagS FAD-binding subunit
MSANYSYVRARDLELAIGKLAGDGSVIHAGGTDLLVCLREEVFAASTVVSISGLEELHGIRETADGRLRIGALTTIAEVAASRVIQRHYPALAEAAGQVASPQLRNQGTLGGNICQKPRCWYYRGGFFCLRKGGPMCYAISGQNHYHGIFGADRCCIVHPSDTAPALMALDATLVVAGPRVRREVKLEEFFVLPDQDVTRETILQKQEIVTDILLPMPAHDLRSSYRKVRARGSWDFALAGVALAVQLSGGRVASARVVLGGVAPTPWRSRAVEEAIMGRNLDESTIQQAGDAAVKGAEPLEHNAYKVPLLRGLVQEQLRALAA